MRSIALVLTAWRRWSKFVVVVVRIITGDVEKTLRDRQRGAQFVGGVGREPLLLADVRFQLGEHDVEAVREFPELVVTSFQLDPVGERPGRGDAGGVGYAGEGGEHASGENPAADETEHK